ncbi:MAG: AMP-dependent synthetase/ligase [Sphingomonadaceae bacterium]
MAAERLRAEERAQGREAEHWPNLVTLFFARAKAGGDAPFLSARRDGRWQALSWNETARKVASLAAALRALGVKPGDRVALVSENRPEFAIADLAIMASGAVSVPTYTTNTVRDHAHVLSNSGAVAAIVSTAKLARAVVDAALQSSHCRTIIGMEPMKRVQAETLEFAEMEGLIARYATAPETVATWATMKRQDLACLIYTSGTGGAPRGVRQHHGAILHNVAGCMEVIRNDFPETGRERFLSFLPLSHAYEHTAGQFLPIGLGAEIFYAEGLDKLAANIEETSPTIMVVVPRLFEVLRQRMLRAIEKQGGLAPRMLGLAETLARKRLAEGRLGLFGRAQDLIVERTLRAKVRQRFGGRMKAMVSGGAPLNPEVGLFFEALGLTILQGYGQTEAGPVISCNRPAGRIKMHTVGPPLRDTHVEIAEDGEILVAGELVMHGYWDNPEETARALQGGLLHTGDVGYIDEDGHIVITDRKKDIIVNDKGENIAPQKVEGMLTLQPEIAQAMVVGDRHPYLVGVVVPDPEFVSAFAHAHGLDPLAAAHSPEMLKAMQGAVDRVNQQLPVTEKVRRVILADAPFTVENQQLTPSMKIRRHVLKQIYGPRLEALYKS